MWQRSRRARRTGTADDGGAWVRAPWCRRVLFDREHSFAARCLGRCCEDTTVTKNTLINTGSAVSGERPPLPSTSFDSSPSSHL